MFCDIVSLLGASRRVLLGLLTTNSNFKFQIMKIFGVIIEDEDIQRRRIMDGRILRGYVSHIFRRLVVTT